jgi:hypothetical protein
MTRFFVIVMLAWLAPVSVIAQTPPWTVVRYPSDETFTIRLVSPVPSADCGKCDGTIPSGPGVPVGHASITRSGDLVTIEMDIIGLSDAPGRYYVYTVDDQSALRQIARVGTAYKDTVRLPAAQNQAFMLVVSPKDGLTRLPARTDVVLYSAVPRGVTVVPRPQPVRGGTIHR